MGKRLFAISIVIIIAFVIDFFVPGSVQNCTGKYHVRRKIFTDKHIQAFIFGGTEIEIGPDSRKKNPREIGTDGRLASWSDWRKT